jgi:hypothetical protein
MNNNVYMVKIVNGEGKKTRELLKEEEGLRQILKRE